MMGNEISALEKGLAEYGFIAQISAIEIQVSDSQ